MTKAFDRFELEKESLRPGRSEERDPRASRSPDRGSRSAGAGSGRAPAGAPGPRRAGSRRRSARCPRTPRRIVPGRGARQATARPAAGPRPSPRCGPGAVDGVFSDRRRRRRPGAGGVSSSVNRRSAARSSVQLARRGGGDGGRAAGRGGSRARSGSAAVGRARACRAGAALRAEASSWRSSINEDDRGLERGETRRSDGRRTASPSNSGVGVGSSTPPSATGCSSGALDDLQPEALRIALVAIDGHPRGSWREAGLGSIHERRRTVLPLPAGAATRVTAPGGPDSRSWSVVRATTVDLPAGTVSTPRMTSLSHRETRPTGPNSANSVEAGSSAARGSCCLDHVHGASPGGSVGRAQRAHEE